MNLKKQNSRSLVDTCVQPKVAKKKGEERKTLLKFYRKKIIRHTVLIIVLTTLFMLDRLFEQLLLREQNKLIVWLQESLGLKSSYNSSALQVLFIAHGYPVQVMLLLLLCGLLFFTTDAYLAAKILYVSLLANVLVSTLQFLQQTPRPFWTEPAMLSFFCSPSFDNPDLSLFCYLFVYHYSCTQLKTRPPRVVALLLALLLLAYLCLSILAGQVYPTHLLGGYFYFLLVYYLVLFSDSPLDTLLSNLTVHLSNAKRTAYYVVLALVLLQVLLVFLLNMSPNKGNESLYVSQFLRCLRENPYSLSTTPRYSLQEDLLGQYNNFSNVATLFGLASAVLGIANSYRRFNGDAFTRGDWRVQVAKSILLVLVVGVALGGYVMSPHLTMFSATEAYIFQCLLYWLLFYLVFEALPTLLFPCLHLVPRPTYQLLHNPPV